MVDWAELSVGIAAVVGLVYVARVLRRLMQDVLAFLSNHLSALTRSQERVAVSLERVAARLERVERQVGGEQVRRR